MLTEDGSVGNIYFKQYLKSLLLPLYEDLGFNPQPDDTHMDLQTRKLLLTWLCKLDFEVGLNSMEFWAYII